MLADISNKFNNFSSSILNKPILWFLFLGCFFLFGLVTGFIFKHFSKIIFFLTIFAIFLLFIAEYFNFIHVKYELIFDLLKYFSDDIGSLFTIIKNWISNNIPFFLSAIFGFFVAFKYL